MRELESSLQQFGEFLLKAQLVRPAAAPYFVRWVRRFLDYAAKQQGVPQPRVASEVVRDFLAHLAVRQQVSASTQNQAFCAILFLCREVLGVNLDSLSPGVRAKRGECLPMVMSMPETMALLGAMSGTPRLMAALIYGGGLRVTECCELRIKDLDFDQEWTSGRFRNTSGTRASRQP